MPPPLQHHLTRQRDREHELREQDASNHGQEWNDDARGSAEFLYIHRNPSHRDEYLRPVFTRLSVAATSSRPSRSALTFWYNRRPVAELGCPPLTYFNQTTTQAWAYLDKTWCRERRSAFYKSSRNSFARTEKASAAVRKNPIDPYFVAVFIALAQDLRLKRKPGASEIPQKICLFLPLHTWKSPVSRTQGSKRCKPKPLVTCWMQYTATITDQYLRKFDDPYHLYDDALVIQQTSFQSIRHLRFSKLSKKLRASCLYLRSPRRQKKEKC
ncbi:hypothetical protein DL98DRAFT_658018 [Cadophora sp. DSE1049]|nr:hypothetical protein DL98DRAFT_658018 [Cadophora sp. DSE1049]